MSKEDIFSKINLKDYNNILENILEQKAFTEDVKNLLLSMLYKIENGYQDYETVKANVPSKKYFLKKVVQIIKEECNKIELIKPLSEESKILEEKNVNYIVNKEEGKIKVYQNERMMLEALIALNQKEIILEEEYELFSLGLAEILTIGNRMNSAEVIRDFNGWSWDITTSQMESKNINIVYQNLLILLENNLMQTWITDGNVQEEEEIELPNNEILRSKYNDSFGITKEEMQEDNHIDYIKKMKDLLIKKYGEEKTEKFINQLIKTAIAIGCNRNKKQKEIALEKQKEIEENLEKMQDNKKYLEELSEKKKNENIKIKEIDTFLNDEKLLKEEYEKRNSKLPNKEKIFSVSHLRIMLEKERKERIEQIKKYNKQMEPKEFVKTKHELEEKIKFFDDISIKKENKVNEEKQIENLQKEFIECLEEKIMQAETKKEISDLLYQLRYYEQMPYKDSQLNKIEIINSQIQEIEEKLIEKACNQKVLITFSKNKSLNIKLLRLLFKTKIINLENTIYILKYRKGILKIEIYDTNIQEDEKEIKITEKVELQVKLNKKIKVWE